MKKKFFGTCFVRRQDLNEKFALYPSVSEVTEDSAKLWANLPDEIRWDPSLTAFRQEYERIHGDSLVIRNTQSDLETNEPNNSHSIDVYLKTDDDNNVGKPPQNGQNNTVLSGSNHINTISNDPECKTKSRRNALNIFKIAALVAVWILSIGFLMSSDEKILTFHQLAIPINDSKSYIVEKFPPNYRFGIVVEGAFMDDNRNTNNFLYISLTPIHHEINNISTSNTATFRIPIIEDVSHIDTAPRVTISHVFDLDEMSLDEIQQNDEPVTLHIASNLPMSFPINLAYDPTPIDKSVGIIYAAMILLGMYILIIWEIIDRTFAATVASTLSIAVLALMNERPTMNEIISWIDVETLLLLFGMMTIVGIMSETGLFDYLAVFAFKITHGKIWPLINCLCIFTAFLSALLDNVTTLLLMGPVSIRLCEVMQLNPIPILMAMIIFSNIGGAMTPIGDPPNIIIASNRHVIQSDVDFLQFTIHMSLGIIFVMIQAYLQLRFKFRSISELRFNEPKDVLDLRKEICTWQQTASLILSNSNEENILHKTLLEKINQLQYQLTKKLSTGSIPADVYQQTLRDLQEKYPIRKPHLLIKSSIAMVFVLTFFFFHSFPYIERLSLGWTALLGAILLLILYDRRDIEPIMHQVEWTTLLFFAALFVLMESMAKFGLIEWIGNQTENVIMTVDEDYRLTIAIIIILWVSAIGSAFVHNIPLTTMMIKVTISLSEKEALQLPLTPLIWALAMGACLGGNGTLIGASANIIAAGVAEQHGYRISFVQFFKVGFPVMLGTLIVASGYLLTCHVLFTWH